MDPDKVDDVEEPPKSQTEKRVMPPEFKSGLVSLGAMVVVVLIGSMAFMGFDDHSFVQSLYAAMITVTTVGYGDFYPTSKGSKCFMVVFVPMGVLFFANALNKVSAIPLQIRDARLSRYVLEQFGEQLTEDDFMDLKRSVDLGYEDSISKNDFNLAMLLRLGKVKPEDLGQIERVFFQLDVAHTGVLGPEDLVDLADRAQAMSPSGRSVQDTTNTENPLRTFEDEGGENGITEDVFVNPVQRKNAANAQARSNGVEA